MKRKINLIFMGNFTYPHGMAGTKRIQNIINVMKEYPDIATRVILQRQASADNSLSGVYEGTTYETVMGDLLQTRMLLLLPMLYYKTVAALKRALRPDCKNVIYYYGPLFFDSIAPLSYARKLGYKIVFDVNEDFGLVYDVSHSFYHYMRAKLANGFSSKINNIATGIVVISSYLEEKCRILTQGRVPIHYMPISVDMDQFPKRPGTTKSTVTLFYAGSFGKKDGIPVLMEAFDTLASKYKNIRLVLTGRGDTEAINEFMTRLAQSPYKNQIEYKGYLDENDYYAELNNADIPCMTRVDLAFAQAGFPFKLGEFLAMGKPVISSRVSDVVKFLENRHNAMLVQAGSSKDICDAVEFLMNNPQIAAAIGTQGREAAKKYFDSRRQGQALISFLEKL